MVYKIAWTNTAWDTYMENISYLKQDWSSAEVSQFILVVEEKLKLLARFPEIGKPRSDKQPNIRQTLIHKRISLIYQVQKETKIIELLIFWNNYKMP